MKIRACRVCEKLMGCYKDGPYATCSKCKERTKCRINPKNFKNKEIVLCRLCARMIRAKK